MDISAMPSLEVQPLTLEFVPADLIFKTIVHFVVDKDYLFACPNLLNMATVIFTASYW